MTSHDALAVLVVSAAKRTLARWTAAASRPLHLARRLAGTPMVATLVPLAVWLVMVMSQVVHCTRSPERRAGPAQLGPAQSSPEFGAAPGLRTAAPGGAGGGQRPCGSFTLLSTKKKRK